MNNEDNTLREFTIYYLRQNYKERIKIITGISSHTDKLYDNYIITLDQKKRLLKSASDTLNDINKIYNTCIIKLIPEELSDNYLSDYTSYVNINDIEDNNIKKNIKLKKNKKMKSKNKKLNIDATIKSLINNNIIDKDIKDIVDINDLFYDTNFLIDNDLYDFTSVDNSLIELAKEFGLNNINDICYLFKIKINDNKDKLELLQNKFTAINIVHDILNQESISNIDNSISFLENNDIDEQQELLLNNICTVVINYKNNIYKIIGFFEHDTINITLRSCQICTDFLYKNKKIVSEILNNMTNLTESFKTTYLLNITIGDLVLINDINDILEIKRRIDEDFKKFVKYTNSTFKKIMDEFLQANLKTKFNIIKFLLMNNSDNSDNSINIAGLLFGVTKDMKDMLDNNSKPTYISDVIYKNLNYALQIKLRKSGINILQELEKLKSLTSDDIDLKKQILMNTNMPQYVKKIALEKFEEMKSGSSEYYKQQQYVKILIDYPWIGKEDSDIFYNIKNDFDRCVNLLTKLKNDLDLGIYGHEDCKSMILELLSKWMTNNNSTGKVIGLKGPPGVGKTMFAKILGSALGIPFVQINIGGIDEAAVLSGHSFTYSSAQPGMIIKKMITAGNPRCIMFFDEVDKAGSKHGINDVINVLIHVTDYNSNDNFNDKFLQEIGFPLNKVLFIFSYNDEQKIDKILRDRIDEIEVSAYSTEDKIKITQKHLISELLKDIGFEENCITIDDETIIYIIDTMTNEAGVRDLKRKLEKIFNKLNLDRIHGNYPFDKSRILDKDHKIHINKDLVDKYLIKPKLLIRTTHKINEIGIINGLYATSISGGILPISVSKNYLNKTGFKLELTGNLQLVIKESAQYALTTAFELIKDEYIEKFIKKYNNGIHLHVTDASQKDGSSAGGAFTCVFISLILEKRIKANIALTGEIDLKGNIVAIGALNYKLVGAKRAGINLVFIPKDNENDFNKLLKNNTTLISDTFKVIMVNNVIDILDYILTDDIDTTNIIDKTYNKTFDCGKYLKNNRV